eukprot:Nk52_evm5s2297 gene=Nk52_evmTU5s2297
MDDQPAIGRQITGVSFGLYTSEEIRKLSVKKITNPILLDNLNHPTKGGLYDPALGPLDRDEICATCSLNYTSCPGHMGYIDLALVTYNPIYFASMFQLLRATCFYCHHLKAPQSRVHALKIKLKLLDAGLLSEAMDLDAEMANPSLDVEEEKGAGMSKEKVDVDEQVRQMDAYYVRKMENAGLSTGNVNKGGISLTKHIHEYRGQAINEFLKHTCTIKRCANCHGYAPSLRRDGSAKIFKMPVPEKYRQVMMAKNGNADEEALFSSEKSEKTTYEDHSEAEEVSDSESIIEEEAAQEGIKALQKPKQAEAGSARGAVFLTPLQVQRHMELLWKRERRVLRLIFGCLSYSGDGKKLVTDPNMFFLEVIPVPPSRFRPPSKMQDQVFENAQNINMGKILKANVMLLELKKQTKEKDNEKTPKNSHFASLINAWIDLQVHVNSLMDSTLNTNDGKDPPVGIRQVLEKKEGLFRKHMMGKRVNYAARSVISPDPYIDTDEIGIPTVFATKLTYPEPVNQWNHQEMRQAVINGPDVHPGATHVEHENGTLSALINFNREGRIALANQLMTPASGGASWKPKKVYRHLRNGDALLLNRQPTLHKPSIMAHKARVLPGEKTIRMHYANCNTYNADFDGDEMNVHFPQSELARAEAYTIANTDNQYLVPTSGKPLRGLIQDHVGAGTVMTCRDTYFHREQFIQLLYGALPDNSKRVSVPTPCIIKPKMLWSGKQLVSAVLKNLCDGEIALNCTSKTKVPSSSWGKNSEEGDVIVRDGELLVGILDKSQFGATAFGLVHSAYEVYGSNMAGKLLTALGRLFTLYLQYRGFTCGLDDMVLLESADIERKDILKESLVCGKIEAAKFVKQDDPNDEETLKRNMEKVFRDEDETTGLDNAMKGCLNKLTSQVISSCLPSGQLKPFPHNNLSLMTLSGAKGSNVNFSQISCLLGQQELEGKRVPTMVSGKTLPSFRPFDHSARAGGYVQNRFLTGIRPQEYFFHCMAGREGLVDTAVKTSRSGYLQRCLIKHLEGMRVHYDMTVRDDDGSVIQFNYGEDSLDVTKVTFLEKFNFMADNYKSFLMKLNPKAALSALNVTKASRKMDKALRKPTRNDPVLSHLRPDMYLGSVSERFHNEVSAFVEKNEAYLDQKGIDADKFRTMMHLKYLRSLAEPGEAVGLLGAQSVGEPSTQMTLNTFHLAGFGAVNVTLGIPRLREILMTASASIKTPLMSLPVLSTDGALKQVEGVKRAFTKFSVADVLQEATVVESLTKPDYSTKARNRRYRVKLDFVPKSVFSSEYGLTFEEILRSVEHRFTKRLILEILKTMKEADKKVIKNIGRAVKAMQESLEGEKETGNDDTEMGTGKSKGSVSSDDEEDGDEDDVQVNEEDGTSGRVRSKQNVSYENDEELVEDEDAVEQVSDTEEMDLDNELVDSAPQKISKSIRSSKRIQDVLCSSVYIEDYMFDQKANRCEIVLKFPANSRKLLLTSIIEKVAKIAVIKATPGISRCLVNREERGGKVTLSTEGVNIRAAWNYPSVIDVNNLYSNDIHAILRTYGVEAARNAIVNEVAGVFKVYGIGVDRRHLTLIADYMTFGGGYTPFNRIGIGSNVSPFLKMSFETTMSFLKSSSLYGEVDSLASPSSRLVLGRVVESGTGCMDVLQPLQAS